MQPQCFFDKRNKKRAPSRMPSIVFAVASLALY